MSHHQHKSGFELIQPLHFLFGVRQFGGVLLNTVYTLTWGAPPVM